MKKCQWCGAPCQRRKNESASEWAGRKFCSKRCANTVSGRRPRGPYTDQPTYRSVHTRLHEWRGPAAALECGCGRRAHHWSFDNDPVGAMVDLKTGLLYSVDLSRYTALCGKCHAQKDLGRTHCINGHPFDDANTYVRPDKGTRQCRACHRQRQRQRQRAKRGASS